MHLSEFLLYWRRCKQNPFCIVLYTRTRRAGLLLPQQDLAVTVDELQGEALERAWGIDGDPRTGVFLVRS